MQCPCKSGRPATHQFWSVGGSHPSILKQMSYYQRIRFLLCPVLLTYTIIANFAPRQMKLITRTLLWFRNLNSFKNSIKISNNMDSTLAKALTNCSNTCGWEQCATLQICFPLSLIVHSVPITDLIELQITSKWTIFPYVSVLIILVKEFSLRHVCFNGLDAKIANVTCHINKW